MEGMVWVEPVATSKLLESTHLHIKGNSVLKLLGVPTCLRENNDIIHVLKIPECFNNNILISTIP